MSAPELKPCPFCGGEAVLDFVDDDAWYVQCDGDDCDIKPTTKFQETREDAMEIWNRRATVD